MLPAVVCWDVFMFSSVLTILLTLDSHWDYRVG